MLYFPFRELTPSTYGFINLSGEWVIQPTLEYYEVGDFVNGFAKVWKGSGFGYAFIDKSGNEFGNFNTASDFDENGLAWVTIFDSYGMFIDKTGNKVVPGEFSGFYKCSFENGLALVFDEVAKIWKYINTSGETILIAPGSPYTWGYYRPYEMF